MAVRIRLRWIDNSAGETGNHIYRSEEPIDPESLPEPLATVGADVVEYVDETVTEGQTYYYRVGAFNAVQELLSEEVTVVAMQANARPVFVSAASSASLSSAFNATLPSGWLPGQLAILHVSSAQSPSLAAPAGWSVVGSHLSSVDATSALFWRVLQVGDAAPTIPAGTNRAAIVWTFEAGTFNPTTPLVQISTNTAGGLNATPSVGSSSLVSVGEHFQMQFFAASGNFATISTFPYTAAQQSRGAGSNPIHSLNAGCGSTFNGGSSASSSFTLSVGKYWASRKIAIIGLGYSP